MRGLELEVDARIHVSKKKKKEKVKFQGFDVRRKRIFMKIF